MAAIDFPAALPPALVGTFHEMLLPAFVNDGADVGMPRRRKRFTRTLKAFSFTLRLTDAQAASLRTFVDTTTSGGVLVFNWTHPVTAVAYEARFAELPQAQSVTPGVWDFAMALEQV